MNLQSSFPKQPFQIFVTPIVYALIDEHLYSVLLCIVPLDTITLLIIIHLYLVSTCIYYYDVLYVGVRQREANS